MASLRKRQSDADAPVSTPPRAAEPASTQPPAPQPEEIKTASPAEEAGKSAIQQRLAEMETAQRQQPQQQHVATKPVAIEEEGPQALPQADSVEAFLATIPKAVANWLRAHPEYMQDAEKNAALQHFHWIAKRETGEEHTPRYVESLERHLGLRPATNRAAENRSVSRNEVPARQQQYAAPAQKPARQQAPAVSYSAPPTREAPSMSTGRPPSARMPLSADELEIARQAGMTPQQYADAKEMLTRQNRIGPLARDGR